MDKADVGAPALVAGDVLRLGFAGEDFGYAIDLGLPKAASAAFPLDPQIKREVIWHGESLLPSATLVDRDGPLLKVRGDDGGWKLVTQDLSHFESMMTLLSDPSRVPEMLALREFMRAWRRR